MQPRGNPKLRGRRDRKTRGDEETRIPITRLDGTIDDPMSCKGTQKAPGTPVSGAFNLWGLIRSWLLPQLPIPIHGADAALPSARCGFSGSKLVALPGIEPGF